MKRLISIVILLSLVIALCGCGKSGDRVILSNDIVEVVRSGRQIRVTDAATGAECVYTITRTRRGTGEAAKESNIGNLRVLSGGSVLVIYGGSSSWIVRYD